MFVRLHFVYTFYFSCVIMRFDGITGGSAQYYFTFCGYDNRLFGIYPFNSCVTACFFYQQVVTNGYIFLLFQLYPLDFPLFLLVTVNPSDKSADIFLRYDVYIRNKWKIALFLPWPKGIISDILWYFFFISVTNAIQAGKPRTFRRT